MDYDSNDPDTVDDDPFPDTMSPMHAGLSSQNSSSGQPFTIVSPLKPDHLVVDERASPPMQSISGEQTSSRPVTS